MLSITVAVSQYKASQGKERILLTIKEIRLFLKGWAVVLAFVSE